MTTNALSQHTVEESLKGTKQADQVEQYNLWQILGIWASVALPMGLIFWVVMPILIPHLTVEPGFVFLVLITFVVLSQANSAFAPFGWLNELCLTLYF
jgi:hypothetical protein